MQSALIIPALALACLTACSANTPTEPAQAPGSDRDEHGCIPSAGYAWCASTNQCERPWELAKAQSFENTQEAFDAFCKNTVAPAGGS